MTYDMEAQTVESWRFKDDKTDDRLDRAGRSIDRAYTRRSIVRGLDGVSIVFGSYTSNQTCTNRSCFDNIKRAPPNVYCIHRS
jgi:hypothetical protein